MAGDPYGGLRLELLEKKLRVGGKGSQIPPEDIARALRSSPEKPLPPLLHAYVCDLLEGKIKKPRGRKPRTDSIAFIKDQLTLVKYPQYLAWLQKRERSVGLVGWNAIKTAHWWEGAPHERAARMTARALGLHTDWRHVLNVVSSRK